MRSKICFVGLFFLLGATGCCARNALERTEHEKTASPIPITEAPWAVRIENASGIIPHFVAGSIVSSDTVITAPHIFRWNDNYTDLYVRAGSNNGTGGSIHWVTSLTIHPLAHNYDYNIGLVTVDPPFQFDETKQAIRVSLDGVIPFSNATINGYGWEETLNAVEAQIYDEQTCFDLIGIMGGLEEGTLCVEALEVCLNDVGAGVVQNNTLIGVMTEFYICNSYTWPNLFIDFSIPAVKEWLVEVLPKSV